MSTQTLPTSAVEEIDLSADDEAALDAAWARLDAEDAAAGRHGQSDPAFFGEPARDGQHDFCREGPNAGKPGPCPDPAKAAARAARAAGAGQPDATKAPVVKAPAVAKPTVDALHAKIQGMAGKQVTAADLHGVVGEMATMKPAELKQLHAKLLAGASPAAVADAKSQASAAIARAKAAPKPVPPEVLQPTAAISQRAATDPSLSYQDIEQHVAGLAKKSKGELVAIAKSVDVTPSSKDTKASMMQKIGESLKNRKGRTERTAEPASGGAKSIKTAPTSDIRTVFSALGGESGLASMGAVYHNLKMRVDPNLTKEQFRDLATHMWKSGGVELMVRNEVRGLSKDDLDSMVTVNDERNGRTVYGYAYLPPAKSDAADRAIREWQAKQRNR